MEEEERVVIVNAENIEEYLHEALIDFGYAPVMEEVELIADLFMDYMLMIGLIDGVLVDDPDAVDEDE
jgi:hypothetical protein